MDVIITYVNLISLYILYISCIVETIGFHSEKLITLFDVSTRIRRKDLIVIATRLNT